jgi:hypothetical protein
MYFSRLLWGHALTSLEGAMPLECDKKDNGTPTIQ